MKSLFPLTILTFLLPCHLPADVSKEIQLGAEAVAGYRSGYVYRGFELAESTVDFQVETEIALSNRTSLNLGSWYATENGKGDFDESAFFSHLRFKQSDQLTIGLSASYRHFGNSSSPLSSVFKDGVDVGTFATWQCTMISALLPELITISAQKLGMEMLRHNGPKPSLKKPS